MNSLKVVITGVSGSGKTSLCTYLESKGYKIFTEGARDLIENGIQAPIFDNTLVSKANFGNLVLEKRILDYQAASNFELSFFDRGLPDNLAYSYFLGKDPSIELLNAITNHQYDLVFILPPWKEIYTMDSVRRESFEESERLHNQCSNAYLNSGYSLVEIPKDTLQKRGDYILSRIQSL